MKWLKKLTKTMLQEAGLRADEAKEIAEKASAGESPLMVMQLIADAFGSDVGVITKNGSDEPLVLFTGGRKDDKVVGFLLSRGEYFAGDTFEAATVSGGADWSGILSAVEELDKWPIDEYIDPSSQELLSAEDRKRLISERQAEAPDESDEEALKSLYDDGVIGSSDLMRDNAYMTFDESIPKLPEKGRKALRALGAGYANSNAGGFAHLTRKVYDAMLK